MNRKKHVYYRRIIKSNYIKGINTPSINNYYIFFDNKIKHKSIGFKTPLNHRQILRG